MNQLTDQTQSGMFTLFLGIYFPALECIVWLLQFKLKLDDERIRKAERKGRE